MAENEDGTEKTEDASTKKLQEAREKGNVPRSRDLSSAVLLVVAAVAMYMVGMLIVEDLMRLYAFNFAIAREDLFDIALMIAQRNRYRFLLNPLHTVDQQKNEIHR